MSERNPETRILESEPVIDVVLTWYPPVKMAFDRIFAVVLLVIVSPVILLASLSIKLTSRGAIFYSQTRVGLNGTLFRIHKLRTMVQNAESSLGPTWATKNDFRITMVGRFLRATHIDEFPQLWNVIRGEMSLIGPRPERPEFVSKLEWEIPHYRDRLLVRPGITGLSQLRLPSDTSIGSVRKKLLYDLYYVQHVSPRIDLLIALGTAWHLFYRICVQLWKLVSLPRNDTIETETRQRLADRQDAESVESLNPEVDFSELGHELETERKTAKREIVRSGDDLLGIGESL